MRLHYSGDINIEYGGMFYTLKDWKWGYVNVVRVTPCSDAGGPDNCFWVDRLTVNIREGEKLRPIIETMGHVGNPEWHDKGMTPAQWCHYLVDAHVAYGAYDTDSSTMVRIGKPDPFYSGREGEFVPDIILRGNTSLRNYVRGIALEHCA